MRRLGSRDFFMLLLLAMMAFFTFSALQQVNRGDAPTYSQIRELFHQGRVEYFTLEDSTLTLTLRGQKEGESVRMVYQVAGAVKVPVIGMGGIWTAEDALEFILAGATAVAVGTANFHNPYATVEVIDGILAYMQRHGVQDIRSLVGAVQG